MTRFGKFIVLALVGFGLGAGLAYYQHSRDTASTSDIVAGAPEMPVAGDNAVASEGAMMAAAPAVAGSTIGGAFSLTDHNNVAVTETSYPGKLKLVFFGFANCPDICPATLDKLNTALTTVGTDADKVQVLFITTDPTRDTPEALKTYLERYPTFVGLTGTQEQVTAAQDAYKVYATPATDGSGNIDHSAYVYLLSEDNKLLDTFSKDDTADAIAEKVKSRVAEISSASSATDTAAPAQEGAVIDQTAPAPDAATSSDAVAPAEDTSSVPSETTAPAGGLDAPSTEPTQPSNVPSEE